MNTENLDTQDSAKSGILISFVGSGMLIDTIIDDDEPKFVVFSTKQRQITIETSVIIWDARYEPISANSSYLRTGSLLLPTEIWSYESIPILVEEIRDYIRKYCDIESSFELIASYYVLLTYVYQSFSEIPYIRVLGDYGSGKSRFLKVIGSICYNAIMLNGWASLSSVFRMIDKIRWTLVLDEADFQFSDTTNDMIKLLNNGFSKGNPVLRADWRGFEPRAYEVFSPKIIGGRREFADKATESRCVVSSMKRTCRGDIPINLDDEFYRESQALRNRLFRFRYDHIGKISIRKSSITGLEGRLSQILNPILSIVEYAGNDSDAETILAFFRARQGEIIEDRRLSNEWLIFGIIQVLERHGEFAVSYSDIIQHLKEIDKTARMSPRGLWSLLKQYNIKTQRRKDGFYVDIHGNADSLPRIYETLGLSFDSYEEQHSSHSLDFDVLLKSLMEGKRKN